MRITDLLFISSLLLLSGPLLAVSPADLLPNKIQTMGRSTVDSNGSLIMYSAGSTLQGRVQGTHLGLTVSSGDYGETKKIGILINDSLQEFEIPNSSRQFKIRIRLPIGESLEFKVIKLESMLTDWISIEDISTDGSFEDFSTDYERKISFYGDSVTAGSGAACKKNIRDCPKGNNAYYSYPRIVADALKADYHNNGIPGLAVQDGFGFFQTYELNGIFFPSVGLETTFDKLNPILDRFVDYDFSAFSPDLVVLALGINDASTDAFIQTEKWKDTYSEIVLRLSEKLGQDTVFLFAVPPLPNASIQAQKPVEELSIELNESGLTTYFYAYQLPGNIGAHPNRRDHKKIAKELIAFITSIPELGWTSESN